MDDVMGLIDRAHHGDERARAQLVEQNMGLVWSIVRRFSGRGTENEDLFQIGAIGLMKAIDKFDCSFEVRFSTYAVPMIMGEIKRFLRDDGLVKVSRTLKENGWKIRRETENYRNRWGREPTLEELAEATALSREEIVESLDAGLEVESIDRTYSQEDGSEISLLDRIDSRNAGERVSAGDREKEALLNRVVLEQLKQMETDGQVSLRGLRKDATLFNRVVLEQLLEELPESERKLIIWRYLQEQTQTKVAERMGISQVQVSRMEKRILKTMRERLEGG